MLFLFACVYLASAQGSSSGGSSFSSSGSSFSTSGYYSSSSTYYSTYYYSTSGYYYSGGGNQLSGGAVAGIVIGIIALVLLITFCMYLRRRRVGYATIASTRQNRIVGRNPDGPSFGQVGHDKWGSDPTGDNARMRYVTGNPNEVASGYSLVFRSGVWNGHYVEWSKQHPMSMKLIFYNGRVAGEGSDPIGTFTFSGFYRDSTRRVAWIKQYRGKHAVEYRGAETNGAINGEWCMLDNPSGTFTASDRFTISLSRPDPVNQTPQSPPPPGFGPPAGGYPPPSYPPAGGYPPPGGGYPPPGGGYPPPPPMGYPPPMASAPPAGFAMGPTPPPYGAPPPSFSSEGGLLPTYSAAVAPSAPP